jgi:di/tricarboxylate transporter
MIISKVITINEAYRAVGRRTVFLLGDLIPLGMAVDQTGTAEWIAKGIIAVMGPGGYRTRDYIKIGGFLAIIYIVILVAVSWAFYL